MNRIDPFDIIPDRPNGYGDGYGYGYGNGDGYGYGSTLRASIYLFTSGRQIPMDSLESGKLYLFMTGDGWAWVGRFVAPIGQFGGSFADCVNICRTGGTSWPELAQGKGRTNAIFLPWISEGFAMPHPFVRHAFPWSGELPG